MDAASTSHMVRFSSLTFRPVKGKNQLLLQFISFYILHSNFEMETGHVVTRMIFHAITADQNARIGVLHRRVSGKSVSFRQKATAKMKQEDCYIG